MSWETLPAPVSSQLIQVEWPPKSKPIVKIKSNIATLLMKIVIAALMNIIHFTVFILENMLICCLKVLGGCAALRVEPLD